MTANMVEHIKTDILVLGSGGAGLLAAIHAADADPRINVLLATKGLLGKSGCTRMVQGGYNVVLNPDDSFAKHFDDTMKGGGYINDEELVWTLVNDAPRVIMELEMKIGVFFSRKEDGTIHQKALAGQSFDRTVHHGDLTGIEIVSRLADQVMARENIRTIDECRGVDLILNDTRDQVTGALLLDIKSGYLVTIEAKAVILATGGGAPLYKVSSASLEKSGDGMAMAFRAGVEMVDMEMVQFHPTGLVAKGSRLMGSVLGEELRGYGGYMLNSNGERFMKSYNPEKMERSTRDQVARGGYMEIMAGRGTENGAVLLDVSHPGAKFVAEKFPGMVDRVKMIGVDLTKEPVEVSPTSHFQMGGAKINKDAHTSVKGLFVAGEDAGGVHGANRLGGNGVADSTVFGARAGDAAAEYVKTVRAVSLNQKAANETIAESLSYFHNDKGMKTAEALNEIRDLMWKKVGVVRNEKDMTEALFKLKEMRSDVHRLMVKGSRRHNLTWNQALNVRNFLDLGWMITASALERTESRGAHYRSDFKERDDKNWLKNIGVKLVGKDELLINKRNMKYERFNITSIQKVMST